MNSFKKELTENILPFWMNKTQDETHGGFYGRIDGHNVLHPQANKGAILNARILWTFSAAYRVLKKDEYLKVAHRVFDYILDHFLDKTYGGAYWGLDYKGNPVNTKKQTYVQGFMLYGFSEFYRATGNEKALEVAKEFFFLIEKCHDDGLGGYPEAYTREWQAIEDVRLSDKDANEKKTMNTHLHILEPYTNLCRVWDDERLKAAQKRLIDLFIKRIIDKQTYHLGLFFDEEWCLKSTAISYGHDIEASWLLYEAASLLNDRDLLERVKSVSLKVADAATEGLMPDGSLIYEKKENHMDSERHWWVQAEAIVGFMYAYKNSGNIVYKEYAQKTWTFIKEHMIDREHGEWYWSCFSDGSINRKDDKAGFWKCPYHNGRMCIEIMNYEL